MRRHLPVLFLIASLVAYADDAPPAKPDDKPLPGHSMNGEAFNEGPRQAAVLMPGTGLVQFPITTQSEEARKFFTQGVGQLHGFWYWEAERSFRQVAALDPDCATAYWGMGMANINNDKRAADFMKEAVKRRDKVGRREQLWIDAYAAFYTETKKDENARRSALIGALENLSYEFPDDLEAKAFLVFQLWDNKQHNMPLPSRVAVDALAKQVLAVNPLHPGVNHYLIHLWNVNNTDNRALPSAACGGQAAPGIAHLWHMPGHTFSGLHRYMEAAWQQEASARVDHAYMAAARIMPEQIHNYAHNNDWLVKNLEYLGRVHEAVELAKNLIELPRLGPGREQASNLGRERLLETLVTFERWDELAALEPTMYLEPGGDPMRELERLRALGLAWFAKGDRERGQSKLDALKTALAQARAERIAAGDKAEAEGKAAKKTDAEITKTMAEALHGFSARLDNTQSAVAELRMARALADGNVEEAKKQFALTKNIPSIRRAAIHFALGENEPAEKLAREAADADEGQLQPRAVLADLLWRMGKKDAALEAFKKLRERSAQIDMDVPIFARLAPLAEELKLPADWRVPFTMPADAGVHPDLAKLGPFRWRPYEAPAWSLPDRTGQAMSLAQFKGKPVLVVFYLGSGCAGCIEQLNVLAPLTKDFGDAGISVVAVSTDTPEGLEQTISKAKDSKPFPFPIVSDHETATFRAYRAYDDFEKMALHGTFLVDGAGLVRWQNISFQPFKDIGWLLGESKRLLSVPITDPAATVAR
jgi:peroxiredoxin